MHFSIIIPTCHRTGDLASCLDRLAPGAQNFPAENYEVIVTDDSADNETRELVRRKYSWAKWVGGPRRGPAANRNTGARQANHEWLAFTDDDCLPDRGWLSAYAAEIEAGRKHSVFEGRTYADSPRPTLASVAPINESGGYLWSCNFAIHRDVFNRLNGFDERFPFAAMEDVDLSLRLNAAGHPAYFVSDASVCHPWRTLRGIRALRQHEHSTLIYLQIHPDERRRINAGFYLHKHLRLLLLDTLPGIVSCRGRGLTQALLMHGFGLRTALRLLTRI
jgi:GT2 family glycosyltransferase